jgi:DNA-binding transcriptional LysR family regulator
MRVDPHVSRTLHLRRRRGDDRRRHLAAAAVSKRMSELEAALRTELLKRTNKGVEATAAGNALLNIARRALHELDDVSVQMRDYASGTRGLVRLFAKISAITQLLPQELIYTGSRNTLRL